MRLLPSLILSVTLLFAGARATDTTGADWLKTFGLPFLNITDAIPVQTAVGHSFYHGLLQGVWGGLGSRMQSTWQAILGTKASALQMGAELHQAAKEKLTHTYGSTEELEKYIAALEARYCLPAKLILPEKVPALFHGPGSTLIIDSGNCEVVRSFDPATFGEVDIVCQKPTVVVRKSEPLFASKTTTPVLFQTESCGWTSQEFGANGAELLYSFTSTGAGLDIQSLAASITSHVGSFVSGGFMNPAMLQTMLGAQAPLTTTTSQ